jgi:hypothetical protein
VAFRSAGDAVVRLLACRRQNAFAEEEAEQQREDKDHQRAADELSERELPAHEQREDDAHLDHEVGARDLERHRCGEVRTLAEQRAGQRDRRVRARARRGTQAGGDGERARPRVAHQTGDRVLVHNRFDRGGQEEPEDQGPADLPRHRPGEGKRMPESMEQGHGVPSPSPALSPVERLTRTSSRRQ